MELSAKELIDDKEVAGIDDDRLGHDDIASQLAELVRTVPTPSNIALYGPWGSGKSGIGNLLESKLKADKDIKFARFDAFKYAENPLRRNFISVVATALEVKDKRFHDALYQGQTTTDFTVPARKIWRLIGLFALILLVPLIVSSVVICSVALLQGENPLEALIKIGVATLPASLVPASLLTAFVALVGKTFTSEKKIERADSDEQFEALFKDLVHVSKAKRVVIFVDELDRCSSDEVVETLNAIRTFLGVDKCVFIVAADQQVLERALTDSLSQPTPVDSLNPYYSSGSAYLDKVFQYQISVPPLMPQSVTSFVVELLKDRPGVWQTIDIPVVASILIPSHVRSPRRVKNLLNSFVLSYRLAQSRMDSKQLDIDLSKAVDELARLVCLSVEFPLFARDLVVDPALSEYVRELSGPDTKAETIWARYPYVDEKTKNVAVEYSKGDLPVDRLLVDDQNSEETKKVHSIQGKQLIDYLHRTVNVKGPTKALIHLQNIGTLFGLPSSVAEQIERNAQNASIDAVSKIFTGLSAEGKQAVIQLLIQQCHIAVGLEVSNISSVILALVEHDPIAALPNVNEIALVVSTAIGEGTDYFSNSTVLGAWEVSIGGSRQEADTLGELVLKSEFVNTNDELFNRILQNAEHAVSLSAERVSESIVHRLQVGNVEATVDMLVQIPAKQRFIALQAIENSLISYLQEKISSTADAGIEDDVNHPLEILKSMDHMLGQLDGSDPSGALILRLLLKVNDDNPREIIEKHLEGFLIQDEEVVALLVEQAPSRPVESWPKWLSPWSAERFAKDPRVAKATVGVVSQLWASVTENPGDVDDSQLIDAATSIAQILDNSNDQTRHRVVKVVDLDETPTNENELSSYRSQLDLGKIFAQTGVINAKDFIEKRAETIIRVLNLELPEFEPESKFFEWLLTDSTEVMDSSLMSDETIASFVEAVLNVSWIGKYDLARLHIRLHQNSDTKLRNIPQVDGRTVIDCQDNLSEDSFFDLAERWLRTTSELIDDVLPVLQLIIENAPEKVLFAIDEWRQKQTETDQLALLQSFVSVKKTSLPSDKALASFGIRELDEAKVVDLIIDRYIGSTTNEKRKTALHLAEVSRLKDNASRKRVILEIIIPMLQANLSAAEIALTYTPKFAKPFPRGSKQLLGDAIVGASKKYGTIAGKANRVLEMLGYPVKRKGFFGLGREVDTSE